MVCEYFHNDFPLFFQVHFWKKGDMGLKPLYNYTEERRAIRLKTYFKFPFVGEPLNRLLTAFTDKFIGNRTSLSRSARDKIVKSYRPRDYISNGENVVRDWSKSIGGGG